MAGELSKGKSRVRTAFNPSGSGIVHDLKSLAADFIDAVDMIEHEGHEEIRRLKEKAMDEIESAAHWAVKAATHPDRSK